MLLAVPELELEAGGAEAGMVLVPSRSKGTGAIAASFPTELSSCVLSLEEGELQSPSRVTEAGRAFLMLPRMASLFRMRTPHGMVSDNETRKSA